VINSRWGRKIRYMEYPIALLNFIVTASVAGAATQSSMGPATYDFSTLEFDPL